MTLPKIKPCPCCAGVAGEHVGTMEWEYGWKQVICYRCNHSGPQCGRFVHAIREWNAKERWPVSFIGDKPDAHYPPQTNAEGVNE